MFVEPTVFADVTMEMTIAREEIFGPVLAVLRWDDEASMLEQVNRPEYGLTCSIWTKDLLQAHRTAMAVEAGFVWVNETSKHFLGTPFGGFKQSGLGREECLEELLSLHPGEEHPHQPQATLTLDTLPATCRTRRRAISGDGPDPTMPDSISPQPHAGSAALERPAPLGKPLFGSDAVAEALRALDIPFIALNPGASYRGLHDSLVNHLGNAAPQMLLCLHEEHAVAIAHGWAKVTGKPMLAAVHSNVGLFHATMAIFNAWCDRMPVIVLGATGPVDAAKRRPWIDWIHTAQDQGAIVRSFVKWDAQPASPAAAREALFRAAWLAGTAPVMGPVYVNLDAGMQEAATGHAAAAGRPEALHARRHRRRRRGWWPMPRRCCRAPKTRSS